MALERQGDYDAALTSYRLALRDRPNDTKILQNMAIAFTKTNRPEDAIRCYRNALGISPELSGAHYGLAFLLLKRGDRAGAERHLQAFLAKPPAGAESERWVRHAQETVATLAKQRSDLRRRRAVAWERFSRSSARKAAWARRPRPSTLPRARALRHKTLLVDADPQGSVRYGLGLMSPAAARVGLSDFLAGSATNARGRAHHEPAMASRGARRGA